jgi:hypothetical protein
MADRKNYVVDQIDRETSARERYDSNSTKENRDKLQTEYERTGRAINQPQAGPGRGFRNPKGVNKGDL